ncbi:chromosome segregation protein SMC [Almyronema epifaneia]|uniref:Chromosome partition protein Smc n=1 Tax=Almyronema epifaneia S1 TaxID=2991925 RepID=A0ABW6I9S2_9CYAN
MHIKSVELSHFKSFGGTTKIPLLPGFTVVSGPNGSGKSNILDALLFALGLSSSKGMRAERLPDLVNQNHSSRRSTAEASVTATFDIGDVVELLAQAADLDADNADSNGHEEAATKIVPLPTTSEWSVTRRLRVTAQGTYTSNYYINGEACTLSQLHEQLQRFRIYPEGYNVVLQGDVTSIISMNPRERREIIDELAGVAAFDRKIEQAKQKLDAVKDREERFHIVERELNVQLERLAQDRQKAEKYQQLKAKLQERLLWETVLGWQQQQQQIQQLSAQIEQGDRQQIALTKEIAALQQTIEQATSALSALNDRVKALGEEDHLALQSTLATQEAERRQLQRQATDLRTASQTVHEQIAQAQATVQTSLAALAETEQQLTQSLQQELAQQQQTLATAQSELEQRRAATDAIANASQAWVQAQAEHRHQLDTLQQQLAPKQAQQVRLQERLQQLTQQQQQQSETLRSLAQAIAAASIDQPLAAEQATAQQQVQNLAQAVAATEQELQVQQETRDRLLQEQRDKQRQLDKLEAQAQALQETQGTQATKVLLNENLPGVCGLVAQLGRVEPRYQLALEIAAGSRLGYLVVEDDRTAAAGIELLKRRRAGRATFLPLNAIRVPRFSPMPEWKRPEGMVDYAMNLIDCEPAYQDVFNYVFGNTVVFEQLAAARRHLGQFRMVTLEGELLETSGAMTGGSMLSRQGRLHFGTVEAAESAEAIALRDRLQAIEQILQRCEQSLGQAQQTLQQNSQALIEAKQHYRERQLQIAQAQQQLQQLQQQQATLQQQQQKTQQELATSQTQLQTLAQEMPTLEQQIVAQREALAELEQSQTHSEWQAAQAQVRQLETHLAACQQAVRSTEQRQQFLQTEQQRLQEKLQQSQHQIHAYRQQQQAQINQQTALAEQQAALDSQIMRTRSELAELDKVLATERANRDRAERQLKQQQVDLQQLDWQRQKLQEVQQERRQQQQERQQALTAQAAELPDPPPEIPPDTDLEKLKQQVRSLQKRLEAMEPVNMLALEEHNRTQERLDELTQKLTTLAEERTELLLRIENFTTLRCKAFKEAFTAVNKNFQAIFAELSDGDGHLQLDDPQDPFNGGLNLVAHPKGKPVRRLASMSGGEKSLTALSFIFALQRYRPSPFYAFDEVDMFLDGANVERLARMIKHQAQQAQFIVVSLRRPMIESSERTIGVTQARGAYTQVLGLNLEPKSASM